MDQLWGQLRDQLRGQLRGQLWDQLGGQKLNYMGTWFNGQEDSYWVSWLLFGRDIGAKYDKRLNDGLNCWIEISQSCYWFYPFLDFCLVSDRPSVIKTDERGRLHNATGAAFQFTDGYSLYRYHGARVPDEIIEHPEKLTVSQIDNEQNAEIRRCMIEIYGQDRYLIDGKAKIISSDGYGTLYRKKIKNDEDLVMVKVINSTPEIDGTYKDYFLRVPPP